MCEIGVGVVDDDGAGGGVMAMSKKFDLLSLIVLAMMKEAKFSSSPSKLGRKRAGSISMSMGSMVWFVGAAVIARPVGVGSTLMLLAEATAGFGAVEVEAVVEAEAEAEAEDDEAVAAAAEGVGSEAKAFTKRVPWCLDLDI